MFVSFVEIFCFFLFFSEWIECVYIFWVGEERWIWSNKTTFFLAFVRDGWIRITTFFPIDNRRFVSFLLFTCRERWKTGNFQPIFVNFSFVVSLSFDIISINLCLLFFSFLFKLYYPIRDEWLRMIHENIFTCSA